MKRYISLVAIALTLAFGVAGLASCTTEDEEEDTYVPEDSNYPTDYATPTLEFSTHSITVNPEGGTCLLTYTISNPAENEKIFFSTDEDWIGDALYSDGEIKFDVEPNEGDNARIGIISVVYTYYGKSLRDEIQVVQYSYLSYLDIVGSYTATAVCDGEYGGGTVHSWTVRIYENDGSTNFERDADFWYFIGDFSYRESLYSRADESGDYTYCARANYTGGKIVVSSYPNTNYKRSTGGGTYKTYLPCDELSEDGYVLGKDIEFTYDYETETWTSNYGVLDANVYSNFSGIYSVEGYTGVITLVKK